MLNNSQIKYFIYQASNLKYMKDVTISIFSVLVDIKKDRKRAHKVFPLISFFFLYPSPFCYPFPEHPIHDEKKKIDHQKSKAMQHRYYSSHQNQVSF